MEMERNVHELHLYGWLGGVFFFMASICLAHLASTMTGGDMPCTFGSTCTTHGQGALHGAASASFAMVGHVVGWFKPKSIHISCTCSDGGWSGLVETRGVPLHGRLFSFLRLGSCSDALAVHRFQSHDASSIVCMDGELRLAPFFLVVLSMYVSMQPAMHTVRPTLHRREETLLWGRDPNPPARQNQL